MRSEFRKVILTEAGKDITIYVKRILEDIQTMSEFAKCLQNPLSGKFRLGAFPTLANYIFPNIVLKVRERMPDLRLILVEEKTHYLIDKIKKGELDAALLALPIDDDHLVYQKLFDDEFFIAVPDNHELCQYKEVEYETIKKYPFILLEEGHCLRDQSLSICKIYNISEEQDFRATGLETLRQMVKANIGITFMPRIAIQEDDNNINYIPFSKPAPIRTIGLIWRKTTTKRQVIKKLLEFF